MYRLLIADQDENTCETIRYLLDWPQYDVSSILTASSYGEAVNLAIDFQPHIALIAVDFGEHRGYELAEYLCWRMLCGRLSGPSRPGAYF